MSEKKPRSLIVYIRATCQEEADELRAVHAKWMAGKYAAKAINKYAEAAPAVIPADASPVPGVPLEHVAGGFASVLG